MEKQTIKTLIVYFQVKKPQVELQISDDDEIFEDEAFVKTLNDLEKVIFTFFLY